MQKTHPYIYMYITRIDTQMCCTVKIYIYRYARNWTCWMKKKRIDLRFRGVPIKRRKWRENLSLRKNAETKSTFWKGLYVLIGAQPWLSFFFTLLLFYSLFYFIAPYAMSLFRSGISSVSQLRLYSLNGRWKKGYFVKCYYLKWDRTSRINLKNYTYM